MYVVLFAIPLAAVLYAVIDKQWRIHVALRAQPPHCKQVLRSETIRFRFAAVSNSTCLLRFGFALTLAYALRALYCIDGGGNRLVLSVDPGVVRITEELASWALHVFLFGLGSA